MWGEYFENYKPETWEYFQYNENIFQNPMEYSFNYQQDTWDHFQYDGNMSQEPIEYYNNYQPEPCEHFQYNGIMSQEQTEGIDALLEDLNCYTLELNHAKNVPPSNWEEHLARFIQWKETKKF